MRTFWGPSSEVSDMGVVADRCLQCQAIKPCFLRTINRGTYLFFLRVHLISEECTSLCTDCLHVFPSESQRYAKIVPIREAIQLPLETLVRLTNPSLQERLDLMNEIGKLGGDSRFIEAYSRLEELRMGKQRNRLQERLGNWNGLSEQQRTDIVQEITDWTRTYQFARHLAPGFPSSAGCLSGGIGASLVWLSLWLIYRPVHHLMVFFPILIAGLVIGGIAIRLRELFAIHWWMHKILVPQAREANISLPLFLQVIDDLEGDRYDIGELLLPLKTQVETIRKKLKLRISKVRSS